MFSRLFGAYNTLLRRKPLATQSATAGVLYAVGDAVAQSIEKSGTDKSIDTERLLRMTLIGGLALGPTMSIWYRFLDRRIVLQSHGVNTIARVMVDQLTFAPVSIVGLFGLVEVTQLNTSTLQARMNETEKRLQDSFVPVLIQNYKLWPAVQAINFFFVPLRFRLLVSNVVAVFWSAYLSSTANKSKSSITQSETLELAV